MVMLQGIEICSVTKMVQDNQNNLTIKLKDKKVKGYVLGIGT